MRKGRFADAIQRADLFSQLLIIEVQSMIKLEHIEVTFGSFKALNAALTFVYAVLMMIISGVVMYLVYGRGNKVDKSKD